MNTQNPDNLRPDILAPAGNRDSFLAAIAAGADAVYCGLKLFSARMVAKNFSIEDLIPLVDLAHAEGMKIYIAINTLLKPNDLNRAGRLIDKLQRQVKPDVLIIQDLGMLPLIKQSGYSGEIHLSTLSNVSCLSALEHIEEKLPVHRVVLPRELNVDEIKTLADKCPPGLDLEVFIHGALCYGVSGRCYWSSYLGGKSGLRGRCVQPCRRLYTQGRSTRRFFSCLDLSLDVLVKVLLPIQRIRAWKIEGRKKGPHYVYYSVQGYRMLRDHFGDPQMKKSALQLLERALGRPGTHYHFLPQRPQNPVDIRNQTGSGMLIGKIKGTQQRPFITAREELLSGDLLRVGYEDQTGHSIVRIRRSIPKGGRFYLKPNPKRGPARGAAVFLIDRREKILADRLASLEKMLKPKSTADEDKSNFKAKLPPGSKTKHSLLEMKVHRKPKSSDLRHPTGIWMSAGTVRHAKGLRFSEIWWWLPPVIWPETEDAIASQINLACKKGGRNFVLNTPWQLSLFPKAKHLNLWAGPFCNFANLLAISAAASIGFKGVFVSPELGRDDLLDLPRSSPLPLGIVISGNWPLCVSRIVAQEIKPEKIFTSQKGEQGWLAEYDSEYWIYPNWQLDLLIHKKRLRKAGYAMFAQLIEPVPPGIKMKKRPGLWNWNGKLL